MHERILRLNIAGSPVEWLNWEDAVTLQARGMVAWTLGSPCKMVRGGRSRQASPALGWSGPTSPHGCRTRPTPFAVLLPTFRLEPWRPVPAPP